jgi:hypothetical protein
MNTPIPVEHYAVVSPVLSVSEHGPSRVTLIRLSKVVFMRMNDDGQNVNLFLDNGDTINMHVEDPEVYQRMAFELVGELKNLP